MYSNSERINFYLGEDFYKNFKEYPRITNITNLENLHKGKR